MHEILNRQQTTQLIKDIYSLADDKQILDDLAQKYSSAASSSLLSFFLLHSSDCLSRMMQQKVNLLDEDSTQTAKDDLLPDKNIKA